jgi:antitoxin component YwqK of YwqJK toxin-antitoxin module
MRKIQVLILILFIALSCHYNHNDDKIMIKEYFDNGSIKSEYEVNLDSVIDGQKVDYYLSGNIESKTQWIDGVKNGEIILYYESGEVNFKGKFKNGSLNGAGFTYYPNGIIKQKNYFINDSTFQFKAFYSTGFPQSSGRVYKNKEIGEFITYFENDSGLINEIMHVTWKGNQGENSYGIVYDNTGKVQKKSKVNIVVEESIKRKETKIIHLQGLPYDSTYVIVGYNALFNGVLYSLDTLRGNAVNKFEYKIPEKFIDIDSFYLGAEIVNFKKETSKKTKNTLLYEVRIPFYLKVPPLPN